MPKLNSNPMEAIIKRKVDCLNALKSVEASKWSKAVELVSKNLGDIDSDEPDEMPEEIWSEVCAILEVDDDDDFQDCIQMVIFDVIYTP